MKRAGWVFAAVALNHVFMILRDLMVAHQFGNQAALNAFLVTMIVPGFLLNVFTGAMNNSLLPKIVDVRARMSASQFGNYLMNLIFATVFSLGTVAVLLSLFAPLWHGPLTFKMTAENQKFAQELFQPAMVIFFLQMSPVFFRVLFASTGHLRVATLGPVINSVALAAALVLHPPTTVPAYLQQLSAAYVLELVFFVACSVGIFRLPLFFRPSLLGFREIWDRHFLFPASSSVFMAFTLMFDQTLAAQIDPSGVVALGYGQKITSSVVGVLAGGMGLLIFRDLANLGMGGRNQELGANVRKLSLWVFAGSSFLVLGLFLFSTPCIRLLFERGAFTSADTELVARINAFCLLQIPFYLATQVGLKGLYSLKRGGDITKIAFINVFLNAGADLVLAHFFGVAGIALATSCVSIFSLCAVFYYFNRSCVHENKDVDQQSARLSRPA